MRYVFVMNAHTEREQLKGWLELLTLALLHHEPTCGYRLKQLAIDKSNHQFSPAFGRLYPLLAELEKAGLLKRRREPGGTRGQQIYSLTSRGEERLVILKEKWKRFSTALETIVTC
jgi:DNA-binding PadR family transcriptional regulator